MPDTLRLPSFVVGPEPGGMGYSIRSSTGVESRGEWTSSLPLVLLEWSKQRNEAGFSGRFAVDGGFVALKAAYIGEGDHGPIAVANGVFVPSAKAEAVVPSERSLFARIPQPDLDSAFGEQPYTLELTDFLHGELHGFETLGLAFSDRHLVTHLDREEQAFRALASIDPYANHSRIRGWSTTTRLVTRGEFRPLSSVSLLVTTPDEDTPSERFRKGAIGNDGRFVGEAVEAPPSYKLWRSLLLAGESGGDQVRIREFPRSEVDRGWHHGLTEASLADVAWRYLEIVSNLGASYAAMVKVISAVAEAGGDQLAGDTVQRYLGAIAPIAPEAIPDLIADLGEALSSYPACLAALKNFVLWSGSKELMHELAPEELFKIVRLLESQTSQIMLDDARKEVALQRVELLEDCFRPIEHTEQKREEREVLAEVRKNLGGIRPVGSPRLSRAGYRRAFRERLQFPL